MKTIKIRLTDEVYEKLQKSSEGLRKECDFDLEQLISAELNGDTDVVAELLGWNNF